MPEHIEETVVDNDNAPIMENEVIELDAPIQVETKKTTALDNVQYVQAAALDAYNNDTSIVEGYVAVEGSSNIESTIFELIGQKRALDKEEIVAQFIDNPGDVTGAQVTQELVNAQDSQSDAKHIVEAMSGPSADEEVVALLENQIQFTQDIGKLWEDMSKLDVVGEGLSFLLPGGAVKDNMDLTGSAFGAEEIVRDMVIGFKSLSSEEQRDIWPSIQRQFLDAMPTLRAIPALSAFLDPVGEESLADFNAFWAGVDTIDFAITGFAIAKTVAKLSKNLNAIKTLKRLENVDDAVDVNTAAMIDESGDIAAKAGVDRTTAQSNTLPFNQDGIDAGYTNGMSAAMTQRVNAMRREQHRVSLETVSDSSVLREDLLSPEEKVLAVNNFEKELTDLGFDNITTVSRDRTSVTLEYSLSEGGEVVTDTAKFNFTLDDKTATFKSDPVGVFKRSITSPAVTMKKDIADFEAAARLNSTQDKIGAQLQQLRDIAVAPILGKTGLNTLVPKSIKGSARQQLAEVDEVMLVGDTASKTYSYTELRAGVNGIPLKDNQIEAYYNLRGLFDNLFSIRNTETRAKFIQQGMKEVQTSQGLRVGKAHRSAEAARGAIAKEQPSTIWIDDVKKTIPTDNLKIGEMYDKGYKLVRLNDAPIMAGKGNPHDFVLVKNWKTKELPEQVLQFKDGYVPRVNKKSYWFVKEQTSARMNGRVNAQANLKTVRYFDNRKEAEAFEQQLAAENPTISYRTLEDREAEKQSFGSTGLGAGGGLYTGARSSEPLRFGKDGLKGERIGTYEALAQNLNSVSKFASHNEWRMGMEKKWLNTMEEAGLSTEGGFRNAPNVDTVDGRHLSAVREQIQDWMGVPTQGEKQWDTSVQEYYEWASGNGYKKTAASIHFLHHKDPIAAMRASAFHTLLGWGNFSQLWVQAQGAGVSMSLATTVRDPLGGLIAVKNQFALQMASNTTSPAAIAKIAKASGLKADELAEMRALWKKSGQEESVLSTADHRASGAGHGVGMEAIKRAADKALLFYRQGELINRRVGFSVALREWKLDNKFAKVNDDALKGILARSNDLQLNLMRANRANFQKGIISVPTQFLQVQAKMLESVLGVNGTFTGAERAKILAGQLALYGAAGIPLAGFALEQTAGMLGLTQTDIEELSPEARKGINDGFWGFAAMSMFGADVDLGQRGSITSGIQDLVEGALFSDKKTGQVLLGAFGQVPNRFFQAFNKIRPMFLGADESYVWPTKEQFVSAVWEIGKMTSTLNNADKAFMMQRFEVILDRNNMVITDEKQNVGTVIGQALGFQASEPTRIRDLQARNRMVSEYNKKIANMVSSNLWNYSRIAALTDMTPEERTALEQRHNNITTALMQTLPNDSARKLVRSAIKARLQNPKTLQDKEIKKFLKNFAEGQVGELTTIKAALQSKGILATGVLD